MAAREGQPAQIPGGEAERLKLALGDVDKPELAGARVQEPELAVKHTQQMRHAEALAYDLAALDVDHHATVLPVVAPAVEGVALRDAGHVARAAILHREPVQVAAILGRQPADEWRVPDGLETVREGHRCQAVE